MLTVRFSVTMLLLTLAALSMGGMGVWSSLEWRAEHTRSHHNLLQVTGKAINTAIQDQIATQNHVVGTFASENGAQLQYLLDNPDDIDAIEAMDVRLQRHFPSMLAYTVAGDDGQLVPDDLGDLVGGLCRRDIALFQKGLQESPHGHPLRPYEPFVHPQPFNYHFDFMVPWDNGRKLMFISFLADELAAVLSSRQLPGQQFAIVRQDQPDLIEVMATGSRESFDRDIRLTDAEMQAFIYNEPILTTRWRLVGWLHPSVVKDDHNTANARMTWVVSGVVLFWLVGMVLLVWVQRQREQAMRSLELARDEAEVASRVKSDFLSVVSHELRTPLTSIRGAIGMLAADNDDALSEKHTKLVDLASRNAERLGVLIDDLLDLEKIQSGRMEFAHVPVSVHQLLTDAVDENQAYAKRLGVSIVLDDDGIGELSVEGDSGRLAQVMANLMSNAAKFSPVDGQVRVTAERQGDRVIISVADDGPGIPAAFHDKLFLPFTQADISVTRQKGGTGLGLAISRVIVDHHHGHIHFTTAEGQGTTFFVDLPLIV